MDAFEPLTAAHIPMLTRFFSQRQTRLCNDSAGAAVLWQPYFRDAFCLLDGTLLLREDFPGLGRVYALPAGGDTARAYAYLESLCRSAGEPLRFFPVLSDELPALRTRYPGAKITYLRDWSDYLYDAHEMTEFRGRRYHTQRNHINRFQAQYPGWRFSEITEADLPEITAFFERLAAGSRKESASAAAELGCVRAFLRQYADYAPLGGVLRVGDAVAGFSAGERVGDTLIIHIEKADTAYDGVYPMLVNAYAGHFVTDGVRFINREEDAGDEGIRKSKLAYRPLRLLEKYAAEIPL